jgi:putative lipoprotein (rSAM/lipoprotein system)
MLFGWALGIVGCRTLAAPEYGMPHADFDLDGKVMRAGTTTGIPGIEVSFAGATAIADASGDWAISVDGVFTCASDCQLTARDLDGDANGSYEDKSVEFSATQVTDGSGTWYDGEWEAHDINVEMEPTEGSSN